MGRKIVFVLFSIAAGFSAGALLTFMVFFAHASLRHGGLW